MNHKRMYPVMRDHQLLLQRHTGKKPTRTHDGQVITRQVPHAVEWLNDNGSCYIAHETVSFGTSVGLLMCTTPAYSPESDGMSGHATEAMQRHYSRSRRPKCGRAWRR